MSKFQDQCFHMQKQNSIWGSKTGKFMEENCDYPHKIEQKSTYFFKNFKLQMMILKRILDFHKKKSLYIPIFMDALKYRMHFCQA